MIIDFNKPYSQQPKEVKLKLCKYDFQQIFNLLKLKENFSKKC